MNQQASDSRVGPHGYGDAIPFIHPGHGLGNLLNVWNHHRCLMVCWLRFRLLPFLGFFFLDFHIHLDTFNGLLWVVTSRQSFLYVCIMFSVCPSIRDVCPFACPFICPFIILLPRYLMNGLSSLDETYREQPLLMTRLDFGCQRSRSQQAVKVKSFEHHISYTTLMKLTASNHYPPTDDLVGFCRSQVKVTAGLQGSEGMDVDVHFLVNPFGESFLC